MPAAKREAMRSPEGVLRLLGGLGSALLLLIGVYAFFADLLLALHDWEGFRGLHFLSECSMLVLGGVCGIFAEIRPHPVVQEQLPFLSRLGGRACYYLFFGTYVIGRTEEDCFERGLCIVTGLYTLGVAGAGLVYAWKYRGLPASLSEPMTGGMGNMAGMPPYPGPIARELQSSTPQPPSGF